MSQDLEIEERERERERQHEMRAGNQDDTPAGVAGKVAKKAEAAAAPAAAAAAAEKCGRIDPQPLFKASSENPVDSE